MPTEAGLPGWFPEDFKADPALLDAFEDAADWHAAGTGSAPDGKHMASLRHLAASGTPAQKKAAAAVLARMDAKPN